MVNDKIVIHGAREHNLKDISLSIPKDKLVVITVYRALEKVHWHLIPYMLKVEDDM